MNRVLRHGAAFIMTFAAGSALAFVGLIERRIVEAEEQAAAGRAEEAAPALSDLESVLEYGRYVPLFETARQHDELRAQRLGAMYKQQRYAEVAREAPLASDAFSTLDPRIQILITNSLYRDRLSRAKDSEDAIGAVGLAIDGYASILRAGPRSQDAAYNYEYLTNVRDDLQKKHRMPSVNPPQLEGLRGRDGSAEEGGPAKVYVPMDFQERAKDTPQNGDRPMKKKG